MKRLVYKPNSHNGSAWQPVQLKVKARYPDILLHDMLKSCRSNVAIVYLGE